MRNFQDTFEARKRSFISAFTIFMTVPLISFGPCKRTIPEAYLRPGQTSVINHFCENSDWFIAAN